MAKKMPRDAEPEGAKKMPRFDGDDDSVEGHARKMPRDAEPEGAKKMPRFDGDSDDDVEGHKK